MAKNKEPKPRYPIPLSQSSIDPIEFLTTFKKGKEAMIIQLKNVRLAFPDLWKPTAFEDGQELKYGATFLVSKKDPQVKAINAAIQEVATEAWKEKAKAVLTSISGQPNKYCFQDGDNKSYDGFQGCMALSAKNKKRPTVVDKDKTPLTEGDEKPYGGCYVNASVEIWAQDNKWGKAIRASLRGVQFFKDGDQFSAGSVASEDEFDDLGSGAENEDEALA
jgi:hypothetical protein